MTREGQRPDPDDELIPPVSTRAGEETPSGEDVLVPPFSSGSAGQAAPQQQSQEGAAEADTPGAASEPEPASDDLEPASDDPFPFDMPWSEEPEASTVQESETDPTLSAPADSTVDESFPFEAFDDDPALPAGPEAGAGPIEQEPDEVEPEGIGAAEDPEPWSTTEPWEEGADPDADVWQAPQAASMGAAVELAERLESLAAKLRAEGADGVESQLASHDRMTSLLAALLAGFLAGRA